MKKIITILILLLSFSSFAQPGGKKMQERIKAQKVAFITERLDLSPAEAEKFWPIYNEFQAKTEKIRSEDLRTIKMKMRQNPDMSDKEADALLVKLMKADTEMHAAKIKLVNDLKTVISSKKIMLLKAAEDQFNKKLLERLREFRKNREKKN